MESPKMSVKNIKSPSRRISSTENKSSIYEQLSAPDKYILEWKDLSRLSEDPHLVQLRHLAINGGLKVSKFRSICWSLLLGVLNGRSQSWLTQRRCDRNRFDEMIRQFYINPRMVSGDDPLSQSDKSVWNQHFCDKELCTVIRQDVVRTFPGIEFFRKEQIQDRMINILFCYARVYPEMCYRQGMHEILAPILFVMHYDYLALQQILDLSSGDIDVSLKEILDQKYLEADAFFTFSKVMQEIEPFYRVHDIHPTATGYFPCSPQQAGESKNVCELEVVKRLNTIRDTILAKADGQLHSHLMQMDIPLPLFGIRWLRLLFGREFEISDLLLLWDAIFAVGEHFELTNYIVVAMLISIREEMLHSDYSTGLSYLMKYPSNIEVMSIIRYSLHMYAPEKYERPPNIFTCQSPSFDQTVNNKRVQLGSEKSATLPRNMHSKLNASKQSTPTTSHANGVHRTPMHLSNESKTDQIHERVNHLQNSTAKATIRMATQSQPKLGQDAGVVDGYLENSPDVHRLHLQNAHTVMAITRVKLLKYLSVFRKHIPGDSLHELHQAMDGIEELCELLKIKEEIPSFMPAPVEPAFEANEAATSANANSTNTRTRVDEPTPKLVKIPAGSLPPLQISAGPSKRSPITDAQAKREFVRTLQLENQTVPSVSAVEHTRNDSQSSTGSQNENNRKSNYELPENKITRTAARIIGNRKELEMHEFMSTRRSNDPNDDDLMVKSLPIIDPSGERQSSPNDD